MTASPLDGVRVLDLTWGMPGAVATMLLADYGADVVRVDRPGGDPASRRGATRPWDRGKRRVVLDLEDEGDRAACLELAAGADVVLVGLDADAVHRFGLGPDAVTERNPDVVYVALTGFGLDDERDTPGLDALVATELGAVLAMSPNRREGPTFLGHPAVDYSTALVALTGVLAALRARVLGGRGDVVDVSLLDGILAQFTMNWWTERKVSFLSNRRADGQLDLGRTRMIVRRYRCRDDRLIQVHTGAAGAFGRLMTVLGLDDRVSAAEGPVESASPLTDSDLEIIEQLPEIFATRTADEWLEEIWANEIAALPVQEPAVAFDDPQVRHNGLIRTIEDPELGEIEVVAPPIRLSRSPAVTNENLAPVSGAGALDWLAPGLGPGGDTHLARGPLDGVCVVELATFFASPYANRFLRDLGAEVIKVEATSGDPIRSLPDPFEGASRGKRSVAVNLKADAVGPVLAELLRRADVVQHNFRPGAAERLGVDYESVRALRPDVVYGYAPGYGSTGPKSRLQSFAPLHSGFVGIAHESAGEGNEPGAAFGNEDYYNGQLNAVGMLLALVHQARTGEGQYVECAQLSSSIFATSHWYRRGGERHSVQPALDADQLGWDPHRRLYQCLEGWLCVFCVEADQEGALRAAVLGPEADAAASGEEMEYGFFARSAEEWVKELRPLGVPCAAVPEDYWLHTFLRDPAAIAAQRATPYEHDQHGAVSAIGRIVQLRGYPPCEPVRAPRLGEHTREVLAELGVPDADVEALIAAGAARTAD